MGPVKDEYLNFWKSLEFWQKRGFIFVIFKTIFLTSTNLALKTGSVKIRTKSVYPVVFALVYVVYTTTKTGAYKKTELFNPFFGFREP